MRPILVFFFSSRRRHTRFDCDWSSDVCSSDWCSGPTSRDTICFKRSSTTSGASGGLARSPPPRPPRLPPDVPQPAGPHRRRGSRHFRLGGGGVAGGGGPRPPRPPPLRGWVARGGRPRRPGLRLVVLAALVRGVGGAKLAPVLSPRKTWAGAVGGIVGGLVAALVYGPLVLDRVALRLGVVQLATVGVVVAVAAQVGDVAESLFKREAGVKDSSSLIPGHGGVLDRLDSLYFVLPATAGLLRLFGVA